MSHGGHGAGPPNPVQLTGYIEDSRILELRIGGKVLRFLRMDDEEEERCASPGKKFCPCPEDRRVSQNYFLLEDGDKENEGAVYVLGKALDHCEGRERASLTRPFHGKPHC